MLVRLRVSFGTNNEYKVYCVFLLELILVAYIIHKQNVLELDNGLYIATIGKDCSFNIYDCLDKSHLLNWKLSLITRSECVGTLVLLEAEGEELNGQSMLWMSCPMSQVLNFCQNLNR